MEDLYILDRDTFGYDEFDTIRIAGSVVDDHDVVEVALRERSNIEEYEGYDPSLTPREIDEIDQCLVEAGHMLEDDGGYSTAVDVWDVWEELYPFATEVQQHQTS